MSKVELTIEMLPPPVLAALLKYRRAQANHQAARSADPIDAAYAYVAVEDAACKLAKELHTALPQ